MNPFLPEENQVFPCPDAGCHRPCATNRKITIEDAPRQKEEGDWVCPGYCYQYTPPESFEIKDEELQAYRKNSARETVSPSMAEMRERIVGEMNKGFAALGSQVKEGFDASEQRDRELQAAADANNALGQDTLHRMKNFSKNKSFGKQWGEPVRAAMRKLWLENKHNPTIQSNLDHPIRKEDVFNFFKKQIARYGVTELVEFESIIEASRKTDGALKGKKTLRKTTVKTIKRKI